MPAAAALGHHLDEPAGLTADDGPCAQAHGANGDQVVIGLAAKGDDRAVLSLKRRQGAREIAGIADRGRRRLGIALEARPGLAAAKVDVRLRGTRADERAVLAGHALHPHANGRHLPTAPDRVRDNS